MLQGFYERIDRLPNWIQPPIIGALILFFLVVVRLLFVFPVFFVHPAYAVAGLFAALVASTGGAFGGLAYSLIGRPLLKVPWVGRYPTGIVCVVGYAFPLLLLLPRILPDLSADDRQMFDLDDPAVRWIWLFCMLFFGLVIGATWFDDPKSPNPRKHRRAQ